MIRKKKRTLLVLIFVMMLSLLIACKQKEEDAVGEENNVDEDFLDEEVTITMMMWETHGQGRFEDMKEDIEAEFPNITLEHVNGTSEDSEGIENALANGIIPDIIFSWKPMDIALLEEYELGFDMTELLEKHEFDLSRFEPNHLEEYRSWAGGELWLLPFMRDVYALHYDKDIFDRFGVDYPTDNMTWEEVISLAAKVTGEQNGVQYQGLEIGGGAHLALNQVMGDQQLIDPETDEVLWVDSPYVKEYLEMVEQVNNIPGNQRPEDGGDPWWETRTLAMKSVWLDMNTPVGSNFDIVTFPVWEDAPDMGPSAEGWAFGVTAPSEHKDAAMRILKYLYEDENIVKIGESPIHTPFKHLLTGDIDFDSLLDTEKLENFKGKNLEALYSLTPAGGPESRSKYDVGASAQMRSLSSNFIESGLDINTFLRELKEKEEIRIENEKGGA